MGDYSDNPKEKLDDAVKKDYVGVRLQQGVPILDSDWNLMEDLRRHEAEEVGKWFIGDGVPTGSDGFRIFSTNEADNFGIGKGICIVAGKTVKNPNILTYKTQPHYGDGSITPPIQPLATLDLNMQYVVYLDTWEIDVDSESDGNIINETIGVETAVRVKRDWAVRVTRTVDDLAALDSPPEGHHYYRLARLLRSEASVTNIDDSVITDLRFTQLSIYREIEVYDAEGAVILKTEDYERMMINTRDKARLFIEHTATRKNNPTDNISFAEILGLQTAERISHVCNVGINLLNNKSLGNYGALKHLYELLLAEIDFVNIWKNTIVAQIGGAYLSYATAMDQIMNLLYGTENVSGLAPAIKNGDLGQAVEIQEYIAVLIGNMAQATVHGSIHLMLKEAPFSSLMPPAAYFTFIIKNFTNREGTSAEPNFYSVQILPEIGWHKYFVDELGNEIIGKKFTMNTQDVEPQKLIRIKVDVDTGSSDLQLIVSADSNPLEVRKCSGIITMTQGAVPAAGKDDVYFQIENDNRIDNNTGELLLKKGEIGTVYLRIYNTTDDTLFFSLPECEIISSVAGWQAGHSGENPNPNAHNNALVEIKVKPPDESGPTAALQVTVHDADDNQHVFIKMNIRSTE